MVTTSETFRSFLKYSIAAVFMFALSEFAHAEFTGTIAPALNRIACDRALATVHHFAQIGDTACGPICEYNLLSGLEETFVERAGNNLTYNRPPATLINKFNARIRAGGGTNAEMLVKDINERLRAARRSAYMNADLLFIGEGEISERDLDRHNRAMILGFEHIDQEEQKTGMGHFVLLQSIDVERKLIRVRDPVDANSIRVYKYHLATYPGTNHQTIVMENPDSIFWYYVDQMVYVDIYR